MGLTYMRMDRHTKVIFMLKPKMDGENILIRIHLIIRDTGKIISIMERANNTSSTKVLILENGKLVRSMDKEYYANKDKYYVRNGKMEF